MLHLHPFPIYLLVIWSLVHLSLLQVVEGDTPLPLDPTCRRKRLRSAGEEEGEEARKCCLYRPNPEGSLSAGELSHYGKMEEEEEELQRMCQRCYIMASQLNRQAAALADTAALKVRTYVTVLHAAIELPQKPQNCSRPNPKPSRTTQNTSDQLRTSQNNLEPPGQVITLLDQPITLPDQPRTSQNNPNHFGPTQNNLVPPRQPRTSQTNP